jgi:hypothetical protein
MRYQAMKRQKMPLKAFQYPKNNATTRHDIPVGGGG